MAAKPRLTLWRTVSGIDFILVCSVLILMLFGLIMVASASAHIAASQLQHPLVYFVRQAWFASLGTGLAMLVIAVPIVWWRTLSPGLLLLALGLLSIVLVPGIGVEVNGSMRWIALGSLRLQPSEFAKLALLTYLAGYLVRRAEEVRAHFSGTVKPLLVLMALAMLLLLEPDYGAAAVLMLVCMGLLFVAGAPLIQFGLWLGALLSAFAMIVVLAPYRIQRLYAFLDPWEYAHTSGFQLTQALIAMGRGGLYGQGLGNSIQKLTYLPEAHTDFLFSIVAEEVGLFGAWSVLGLYTLVVWRGLTIARNAALRQDEFAAYLAYGITFTLGGQAAINLGVNTGLLPTKGLTLPLFSYGGSSMVIVCLLVGLLLRISIESSKRL